MACKRTLEVLALLMSTVEKEVSASQFHKRYVSLAQDRFITVRNSCKFEN